MVKGIPPKLERHGHYVLSTVRRICYPHFLGCARVVWLWTYGFSCVGHHHGAATLTSQPKSFSRSLLQHHYGGASGIGTTFASTQITWWLWRFYSCPAPFMMPALLLCPLWIRLCCAAHTGSAQRNCGCNLSKQYYPLFLPSPTGNPSLVDVAISVGMEVLIYLCEG